VADLTVVDKPYAINQVTLSWSAAFDDESETSNVSGIKSYFIYRSTALSINQFVGEVLDDGSTSYSFIDIFPPADNLECAYLIRVVDKAGNTSSHSNVDRTIIDNIAPVAPTISYSYEDGAVIISWAPVDDAGAGYAVFRNGMFVQQSSDTKYIDQATIKGSTYSYYVVAVDLSGLNSGPSNTLEVFIPQPRVSSVATAGTGGNVLAESTTGQEETVSPSPSPSPLGEVQGSESTSPSAEEEAQEEGKTNWSLIIAIIIAAIIVIAGLLYWWYSREEDEI
jgi:fibronectin type 3 domain-containing protein